MKTIQVWIGVFRSNELPEREARLVITENSKDTFKKRQEEVVDRFVQAGFCLYQEHWINTYLWGKEETT